MYIYIYIHTNTHTHTHTREHIYTHTHTHTFAYQIARSSRLPLLHLHPTEGNLITDSNKHYILTWIISSKHLFMYMCCIWTWIHIYNIYNTDSHKLYIFPWITSIRHLLCVRVVCRYGYTHTYIPYRLHTCIHTYIHT